MNKKDNIVTIDFNVWTTQLDAASHRDMKLNTLSRQVKRSIDKTTANPIEYWHIPQLGITLVKK